jgi:diacylglycerol O-acyltransferase
MQERLSPLDAAFLRVESPTAHMHVGFAAVLNPPPGAQAPRFPQILEHVERRLCRAPRYRQMLAPVPFGLHHPAWVDDPDFDVTRHVVRSRAARLGDAIDECMSEPLPRDQPLWQIQIADRLEDGTLGVVGKAHHCMVDGVATVELASLLLDAEREARHPPLDDWRPQPGPERGEMITAAVADRLREGFELARLPARLAGTPQRILALARQAPGLARAVTDSLRPAPPGSSLNESISPLRHLALLDRPLADLLRIKNAFGVSLNDTVLAVSAAGVRRFLAERGEEPLRLKTMVPVNVRASEEEGQYGNRISFMFVDLPCDEPNAVRRLMDVHLATSERKDADEPRAADRLLRSIVYLPHTVQQQASRLIASPRTFNLVVSNIPGPREPLYMCGCELERAYPVVPLADKHALSIGITTIADRACFGLYCDRESLPDADSLAGEIDRSIDELLTRCVERTEDPAPAFVP